MLITLLKGKLLMEMLDIFDENHNLIGTCSKKEVHEKGIKYLLVFLLILGITLFTYNIKIIAIIHYLL